MIHEFLQKHDKGRFWVLWLGYVPCPMSVWPLIPAVNMQSPWEGVAMLKQLGSLVAPVEYLT